MPLNTGSERRILFKEEITKRALSPVRHIGMSHCAQKVFLHKHTKL